MAVADEAEGWAEAQRRIAVCRETRSEILDLSNLRLTRVPEEVFELDWLRGLDLSNRFWSTGTYGIGNEGALALSRLVNLTSLGLETNKIGDEGARALSALVNLTWLNLGNNQIGDEGVRAVSGLVNLTWLKLWYEKSAIQSLWALSGTSSTSLGWT